jgi:hypothetical protein
VDAVFRIAANPPGDRLNDRLTRSALREHARRRVTERKPAESEKRSAMHQKSNLTMIFDTLADSIDSGCRQLASLLFRQ